MPTDLSPTATGGGCRSPAKVKAMAIASLNRLADRDTFAMAAAELEAMAAGLPPDSIAAFLACIHGTDASHRSPVRRQCVRLLSTLARAHRDALAPLLPRLLAAVLRRLRDPDSAVRAACVDAVAAAAASVTLPPFAPAFLKPLSDAILANHDAHLQAGAALCLAAAVDSSPAVDAAAAAQMQRVLPRFLKLLKSDGFKAKPALVTAIGSMVGAGGARSESLLKALVPCLVELLRSEDWAVRKAATEALIKVATVEGRLVGEHKERCMSAFEARRFDKVRK